MPSSSIESFGSIPNRGESTHLMHNELEDSNVENLSEFEKDSIPDSGASIHLMHNESEDSNVEDLSDFKKGNSADRIYREYDPPRFQGVPVSWKAGRPTYIHSWLRCTLYSFIITAPCGAAIAVIAIFIVWIYLNLGTMCQHFNGDNTWYTTMPIGIRNALLTKEVTECMVIQCWYLLIILPTFGWRLVKKLNILPSTLLVASIDAIYRLLLNVYRTYNRPWGNYPLNFLFVVNTAFISYKVASEYRQHIRQRLRLAFALGAQFFAGYSMALILNHVILYYFNIVGENSKAILASLSPALFIIPKAVARQYTNELEGLNHPGTSFLLLMPLTAAPPIMFRILQAKLHGFWLYFGLSIVHGIKSTFDKLTLPLQDYILHRCCRKRQQGQVSKERKPRVNRLYADMAIVGMIAESSSIIVSAVVVQMCRYYYGRDNKDQAYDAVTLFTAACWRVITGITVEFLFNIIAIKVQTYYYNIPIVAVWRRTKRWLLAALLIHTVIGMFYFGAYFYNTLRSNEMFDKTIADKCTAPFHMP